VFLSWISLAEISAWCWYHDPATCTCHAVTDFTRTFRRLSPRPLESVTLSSLIFGKTRKWSKALPLMFIGHMLTGAAHIISFSAAMLAHGLRRAARTAFKPNLVARTLRQTQQRTLPACSQLCKYNKYLKLCSNFALEVGFFWEGTRKKARWLRYWLLY